MKLYGGIDLHSNNSVIALSDEEDRVVFRRREANDLERVLSDLPPYGDGIEGLVVESTYNWYWLVDGLMAAGYRLRLANTAAIVQYEGLKYADDDTDARWLAKLLRLGMCISARLASNGRKASGSCSAFCPSWTGKATEDAAGDHGDGCTRGRPRTLR